MHGAAARVAARGQEGGCYGAHGSGSPLIAVIACINRGRGPRQPKELHGGSGNMRSLVRALAVLLLAASCCRAQVRIDGVASLAPCGSLWVAPYSSARASVQGLNSAACKPQMRAVASGQPLGKPPLCRRRHRRRRCLVPPPPASSPTPRSSPSFPTLRPCKACSRCRRSSPSRSRQLRRSSPAPAGCSRSPCKGGGRRPARLLPRAPRAAFMQVRVRTRLLRCRDRCFGCCWWRWPARLR